MRLIDADALLRRGLKEKRFVFTTHDLSNNEYVVQTVYKDLAEFINEAPTIDAEPVRHGRWVKCQGKSNIWYCSECGEKINYKQNRRTYNIPKVPVWQKNKRCRNCGAKMGGAEDGKATKAD